MSIETNNDLMTTKEAAELLGVSIRTLMRIAKDAVVAKGNTGGGYAQNQYDRTAITKIKAEREKIPCAVCKQRTTRPGPHKTCGHPRCVREWRDGRRRREYAMRKEREAKQVKVPAPRPPSGVLVISWAWQESKHLPERDRYVATAIRANVSVATVISVIRSTKRGGANVGMARSVSVADRPRHSRD